MDDDNVKYYTIGEVSSLLNIKESTLRYWQKEFSELNPKRTTSNRRMYGEDDIKTIKKIIHLLVDLKYTIAGAKEELAKDPDIIEQKKIDNDKITEQKAKSKKESKKEIKQELKNILEILDFDKD